MLVLTRKRGESLVIGDDVVVKVLRITESSVRLAVSAPATKKILRAELLSDQTCHRADVQCDSQTNTTQEKRDGRDVLP